MNKREMNHHMYRNGAKRGRAYMIINLMKSRHLGKIALSRESCSVSCTNASIRRWLVLGKLSALSFISRLKMVLFIREIVLVLVVCFEILSTSAYAVCT